MTELHPLTELMLARMKSHPDEFLEGFLNHGVYPDHRWGPALRMLDAHGSEQDKQAINDGLRPIRMDEAHRWAMDELLNGEERRRKQREEEADYMAEMQAVQQQVIAQNQLATPSYGSTLAAATGVSPKPNPRSTLSGLLRRSKP